jgi:hypothetical protein
MIVPTRHVALGVYNGGKGLFERMKILKKPKSLKTPKTVSAQMDEQEIAIQFFKHVKHDFEISYKYKIPKNSIFKVLHILSPTPLCLLTAIFVVSKLVASQVIGFSEIIPLFSTALGTVGSLLSVVKNFFSKDKRQDHEKKDAIIKKKYKSITREISSSKDIKFNIATCLYVLAMLFATYFMELADEQRIVLCVILAILIIAMNISRVILWYRIRKGLYGNNPSECLEILSFIAKNSDKIDKGTKLYNEELVQELGIILENARGTTV